MFLPHEHLLKYVVKFLSHSSQILDGTHVQIIGEPTGAKRVKVLTSQTLCATSEVPDT